MTVRKNNSSDILLYLFLMCGVQSLKYNDITDGLVKKIISKCIDKSITDKVGADLWAKYEIGNFRNIDFGLKKWGLCVLAKLKIILRENELSEFDTYREKLDMIELINQCKSMTRDLPHQAAWEYIECYSNQSSRDFMVLEKNRGEYLRKLYDTTTTNSETVQPWFMKNTNKPWVINHTLKLFPEDDSHSDRITDQLLFTLPRSKGVEIKKILLANGIQEWDVARGQTEFINNKCPVDRCSVTEDWHDFDTSDAVLFTGQQPALLYYYILKRPRKQIWLLRMEEGPYYTPRMNPILLNVYNWTASYRRDSEIVTPYAKWVYYNSSITQKKQPVNYAAKKSRLVAWFVSNCNANNERKEYATELSKYISVDTFGRCGPNCSRHGHLYEMLKHEYKFYLSLENSNCVDYISEKLYENALLHDVVPIVMGARISEYAAAAPHNSYIHVEEFSGPQELATYLHRVDKDDGLYNSYFKWKGTGEFMRTYFFCRLCALLHASDLRRRNAYYSDIQAWWRRGTCTKSVWGSPSDGKQEKSDNTSRPWLLPKVNYPTFTKKQLARFRSIRYGYSLPLNNSKLRNVYF